MTRGAGRAPILTRLRARHRTIWPTREGWWFVGIATLLGVAAVNTGNNLLYLLVSMMLGLLVVSGVLSEVSIRGVTVRLRLPDEIHAGRPAPFEVVLVNGKRRLPSYSVTIEIAGGGPTRLLYSLRMPAGATQVLTWQQTLARRGRQRLGGLRIATRFPFGLFRKAGPRLVQAEVIVYPALADLPVETLTQMSGAGPAPSRRQGRGSDVYDLREYQWGDDPRLIHWRTSAKSGSLVVREGVAESRIDTRIVLVRRAADPILLETGLSQAAAIARHLLRTGAGVELLGPGVFVALGRGRPHEHRVLTALALYEPPMVLERSQSRASSVLREICVPIG